LLGQSELQEATVQETLGCVLKYEEDLHKIQGATAHSLVAEVRAGV